MRGWSLCFWGRQRGGHGVEQGLEETGGAEFAGFTDDQPSLTYDQINSVQARP